MQKVENERNLHGEKLLREEEEWRRMESQTEEKICLQERTASASAGTFTPE